MNNSLLGWAKLFRRTSTYTALELRWKAKFSLNPQKLLRERPVVWLRKQYFAIKAESFSTHSRYSEDVPLHLSLAITTTSWKYSAFSSLLSSVFSIYPTERARSVCWEKRYKIQSSTYFQCCYQGSIAMRKIVSYKLCAKTLTKLLLPSWPLQNLVSKVKISIRDERLINFMHLGTKKVRVCNT